MRRPGVALQEDEYNAGAVDWLGSGALRTVSVVLGAVATGAWVFGVVCSVASWRGDSALVTPIILARVGAFTALPALFWLVGNLFRVMRISTPPSSWNPVGRQNRAVTSALFGLSRPTRFRVLIVATFVAAAAAVIVVNAMHGVRVVEERIAGSQYQISRTPGSPWSTVSEATYRSAQGADLRNNAMAILLADTLATLAMAGLFWWGKSEADDVQRTALTATARLAPARLTAKRRRAL